MSDFMSLDDTKKMVIYLAKHTKYGKTFNHEDDFVVYHEFSKSLQKSYLRQQVLKYVASGKDFPTPREWGEWVGTVQTESLDDAGAYVIMSELLRAAQAGSDKGLSDEAQYVLRWLGTSFYDYRYNDKVREKISIRAILAAFKAKPNYEAKLTELPEPEQDNGKEPKGSQRWITPSGKEVTIYPQGSRAVKRKHPKTEKSKNFAQDFFDMVKKEKEG